MAVEIIQHKTCDWCGGDDEVGLHTHRLVWDRKAVEVEVHHGCMEEANIPWLLEHGRKATVADVASANGAHRITCPVTGCGKASAGTMGFAQHLAGSHPAIPKDERQQMVQTAKERSNA